MNALLADAPRTLRAALAGERHGRSPRNGALWFTDGRCGICGGNDRMVLDHCHVTGWDRGYLCTACNLTEGRVGDNATGDAAERIFYAWRRTAPLLDQRRQSHWGRDPYVTDDDLDVGLSIDELFKLHAGRRIKVTDADRRAADLLGELCALPVGAVPTVEHRRDQRGWLGALIPAELAATAERAADDDSPFARAFRAEMARPS